MRKTCKKTSIFGVLYEPWVKLSHKDISREQTDFIVFMIREGVKQIIYYLARIFHGAPPHPLFRGK